MHGEEESLSGQRLSNDHRWRTAEISLILGSESLRNVYFKQPLHVVQMGFKKKTPGSSKNKLQHIQLSDTTGTSTGTGFYGQMKHNKSFLASNPPDSANRDIKYPISTVKYSLIFWAYFSVPGSDKWHHGLYKIPRYKKSKPDCLCKKSYNGPCLDLPSRQWSKNTAKSTQKCVAEHKTKLLPWLSQLPDLNPVENEWGKLKRRSTNVELVFWRIWRYSGWSKISDLLSGVLQTHQAL